jgi:hypothetical protein
MKNRIVGVTTLIVVGLLLIALPNPKPLELKELHLPDNYLVDSIEPEMVAKMIVDDFGGFTILDLRADNNIGESKIESAVSLSLEKLLKRSSLSDMEYWGSLILADDHRERMLKAAYYLSQYGIPATIMNGGFAQWRNRVLTPPVPGDNASDLEFTEYKELLTISNFLQGKSANLGGLVVKKKKRILKRVVRQEGGGGC